MSLRVRLLLTTLLILGIVVTAVILLSGRASVTTFREFIHADTEVQLDRTGEALARFYTRGRTWDGVDSLLATIGHLSGERLLLVGGEGHPVAATALNVRDAEVSIEADGTIRIEQDASRDGVTERRMLVVNGPHVRLRDPSGAAIGTLYLVPGPTDPGETAFTGGVNRRLLATVAFAGLIGIALTLAVSRRIVKPIEALTEAARRMRAGDFSRRVPIASKDEVGQLARAMNEMADNVVRIEGLRRQMVSDVAHELRTPLTNIRCQIEAMEDGLLPPGPETLASLHDEVRLLNRLIEDLQDLAIAEAGQMSLEPGPVSVAEEITRAVTASGRRAATAGVRLETRVPGDLPPAFADARRLAQVLRNLIDNGITHTPPGGVVETSARAGNGAVEVRVADTGQGIAPEHLPNVFERFYRADPSRSRGTGGFGLGLAIVKQLVLAQGGTIRVESRPNEGTVFTFTLPVAAAGGPGNEIRRDS